MDNLLRKHRTILYRLKRNFGMRVVFHMPIENDYDVTTGEIERAYVEVVVRRAIVLPVHLERTFAYDLSYIASNKNFTYGGLFDKSVRNVIVQTRDLNGFVPELNWQCVFQNRKYVVKDLDEAENNAGYILTCNALDDVNDD